MLAAVCGLPPGSGSLTWLAAFCVLVVAAGWAVRTWNPEWLVQAHILRTTQPAGDNTGPGTRPPTSHQKYAVEPVAAGAASAAFLVRTADFTVTVATTGRCWIEVTSSGSSVPLLEGVQRSQQGVPLQSHRHHDRDRRRFAVLVGVNVDGKNAYLNKPSVTPFTYMFLPPKGG